MRDEDTFWVLIPQCSVFIAFETKKSSKIEKILPSRYPAGHNLCQPGHQIDFEKLEFIPALPSAPE